MVGSNLWCSVVAKINITYSGGSSSIFRSALKAAVESICASSMINILYLDFVGLNRAFSMIFSRTLSTPVWLAASISITSIDDDRLISLQISQLLHGSTLFGFFPGQLTALARRRAAVVLPIPLEPENK